jgi:hypothetical protein
LPSARPSEAASSTAPKRRGSGIPIKPSLQANLPFGRSPVRGAHRVPTAIRPSALRPRPSQKSLPRRRSASARTVVRAKTDERRAVWRCRFPLRKNALVTDFAVCARNPVRFAPSAGAPGSSVPSGGAVRRVLGVGRFPRRRNALEPSFAVGTDLAAVRVWIGRAARRIQRCSRFVRAVRALGSSSARLRNAAHCQGRHRARPDWSLVPDPSPKRRVRGSPSTVA